MKSSMLKKKESLASKCEGYPGDIKVSADDVTIVVHYVWEGEDSRSFAVETPLEGESYTLVEFKQLLADMAEDSGGYTDVTRDGSDIVVEVYVPGVDALGYDNVLTIRGTVRIVSTSLESIVDYISE